MTKYITSIIFLLFLLGCKKEENTTGHFPISEFKESTFTDPRDNHTYKTLIIGDQEWMIENLKYRPRLGSMDGCWSYGEATVDTTRVVINKDDFKTQVLELYPEVTQFGHIYMWLWMTVDGSFIDARGSYFNKSWDIFRAEQIDPFYGPIPDYTPFIEDMEDIAVQLKEAALLRTLEDNVNWENVKKYGYIYEFSILDKIAPPGWRIPTDEDFKKLETTLGLNNDAIEVLEEWRWINTPFIEKLYEANDHAGTIIFGINNQRTPYRNLNFQSYYWTTTEVIDNMNETYGIIRAFQLKKDAIYRGTNATVKVANSVICIKDLN